MGGGAVGRVRGLVLGIGVHAIGLGIGLISSVLLARLLGPEAFGVYGFAYNLATFLGIPLHVGLATLLIKEVASLVVARDWPRLHGIVRGSYAMAAVLSLTASAVLITIVELGLSSELAGYSDVAALAALLVPTIALSAIRGGILRGLGHPLAGQVPDTLIRPGLLAASLLTLAYVCELEVTAYLAMLLHLASAFFALVLGLGMSARLLPREVRGTTPRYEWKSWAAALLPLSLLAGIQALSSTTASVTLASLHTATDLGYYRVAELGQATTAMPLSAVAAYAAGNVARLYAEGDREALQREVKSVGRLAFVPVCTIAVFVVLFAEPVLRTFLGESFAGAAIPLKVLCVTQALNASVGIVGAVMNMTGNYRETVSAFALAFGSQVVAAIVLVPRYGATGAALSAGLGTLVWSQVLSRRIKARFSISTSPF